jgi:hypothetical protein
VVREAVYAVLGYGYDVTEGDWSAGAVSSPIDVLIIGLGDPTPSPPIDLPFGTPVVWLLKEGAKSPDASALSRSLSEHFRPEELRAAVDELIERSSSPEIQWALARLQPPLVDVDTGVLIRRTLDADLPLFVYGERSCALDALASAVHLLSGASVLLRCAASRFHAFSLAGPDTARGTLVLDQVTELSLEARERLLSLMDQRGRLILPNGADLRLIVIGDCSPEQLGRRLTWPNELFYKLTTFPVPVLSLRERRHEISKVIDRLWSLISASSARPVTLTKEARRRLAKQPWFGDVPELEATLTRAFALRRSDRVDADDLRLEATQGGSAKSDRTGTRSAKPPDPSVARSAQVSMIHELAHDLKNPMVAIKTFAHRIQQLQREDVDDQRLAALAIESVDRMDRTIENLIEYTRLDGATRTPIPLARALLAPIRDFGVELKNRGAALIYVPPPESVTVLADEAHLRHALVNLFQALARRATRGGAIGVRFAPPATLAVDLPEGSLRLNPLASLLDQSTLDSPPPLGLAMAADLLERNGALLDLSSEGSAERLLIRFATSDSQ